MRPIPGCPGYAATEDGRIWSFWKARKLVEVARELPAFDRKRLDGSPSPYLSVGATRNGKRCNRFVHDLVCVTFHGERPSPDHVVRHGPGGSRDNRAANLTWGTVEENTEDRHRDDAWGRAWRRRRATMPLESVLEDTAEDGHAFSGLIGE